MSDGKVTDWLEDENAAEGRSKDESASDSDTGARSSVSDRPSTLMYLPPELSEELDVAKARLKAAARRQGDTLSVNRHIYPALIRTALDNLDQVREELDLGAE